MKVYSILIFLITSFSCFSQLDISGTWKSYNVQGDSTRYSELILKQKGENYDGLIIWFVDDEEYVFAVLGTYLTDSMFTYQFRDVTNHLRLEEDEMGLHLRLYSGKKEIVDRQNYMDTHFYKVN